MTLLRRLPIRIRLVVGFAAAMAMLLALAGAFVFWRVRISLDHRLNEDLRAQSSDLVDAVKRLPPAAALRSLRDEAREAQLYAVDGSLVASGPGIVPGERLLTPARVQEARRHRVETHRGNLLVHRGAARILAVPIHGRPRVAVAAMAVRLDQRDEALRELLAQLAIVNGLALLIASLLGYRFTRAALDPVERYRRQAEEITHGAAGVRLDVPPEPQDELTRLGETLNTMIDSLERAAERERHFIDDASHELRTPLTALAAEIAIALRKRRTPEEYEATLRRLEDTTAELLELAETLLALGALEGAGASQESVAVDHLLAVAAERAASQVDGGRHVHAADVDDLAVCGDRRLLERALGNLADNATRHGSGDIEFSARETGAPGYVALAVHDDGAIDPDFLAHAAERFRRHDDARARAGTGLGLAVVDAIAHASDGQLRICSNGMHHLQPARDPTLSRLPCGHPEGGTTVTVLVPAERRAASADARRWPRA